MIDINLLWESMHGQGFSSFRVEQIGDTITVYVEEIPDSITKLRQVFEENLRIQ